MSAHPKYEKQDRDISTVPAECINYELSLCAAVEKVGESKAGRRAGMPPIAAVVHTSSARRVICHPNEWSEFISVICQGWAIASISLPDGRRQVLSILLPGDMFALESFIEPTSGRLVEAVTDVTYRSYKRSDIKSLMFTHPVLFETVAKLWIEQRRQTDQLAVDLGRRTADERIARLILDLMDRLSKRGMTQGQIIEFPLRQHQIADATGLTSVHVSKVMSEFRRSGLIEVGNRTLRIIDLARLRHIAGIP